MEMKLKFKKSLIPQTLALIPVFICAFMLGCATNWITNAMYFLTKPNHQPHASVPECSYMASFFEMGKVIFAIPAGILVQNLRRKNVIVCVGCMNFISWVTLSFCESLILIYIVRFALGISAALFNPLSSIMIGEIASPYHRGVLNSLQRVAGVFGLLFESMACVIFNSYAALAQSPTILALFFFPSIAWLIESPYYLMQEGKCDSAKRSLQELHPEYIQYEIDKEITDIKECVDLVNDQYFPFIFFKKKYIQKLIMCAILLNMFCMASGGSSIALYITDILPENEYLPNSFYPLIGCMVQLISSLVSPFLIDRLPRRFLFMSAGIVSFLLQSFNAVVYFYYITFEKSDFLMWSFLMGNFSYLGLSGGLMVSLYSTVKSEILPYEIRGFGNGLCTSVQALVTVGFYQIFNIVNKFFPLYVNYAIFSVNSLILVWVVYVFLPETVGKTLAEIQKEFYRIEPEKEEIKKQVIVLGNE